MRGPGLRAVLALALGAMCANPAGAASNAPSDSRLAPLAPVEVARGDQWVYETRDTLTGESLSSIDVVATDVRPNEIDVRLRITAPATGLQRTSASVFDKTWRKLPDAISPGEGAQDSWGYRPKLMVGEEWSYSFQRTMSGGPIRMDWIGHGEALSVERLDLPNGRSVQALRIEYFERPAVSRYRFAMHVTEWFAPEINRYVRREVETKLNGEMTEATTEVLQDYVQRR